MISSKYPNIIAKYPNTYNIIDDFFQKTSSISYSYRQTSLGESSQVPWVFALRCGAGGFFFPMIPLSHEYSVTMGPIITNHLRWNLLVAPDFPAFWCFFCCVEFGAKTYPIKSYLLVQSPLNHHFCWLNCITICGEAAETSHIS